MGKRSRRIVGAAGLACAMVVAPVVTAAPANAVADWPSWEVRTTQKWAGYGKFNHAGDRILAADQDFDGYSVAVLWRTNYGRDGVCRNSNGAGDGSEKVCNYDMAEQGKIKIQACLSDGSAPHRYLACGKESNWVSIGDGTGY